MKQKTSTKNKKLRRFGLRLTEKKLEHLIALERSSGLSRSDILRAAVSSLHLSARSIPAELLQSLDRIGGEIGRCGNNINQIARHANAMARQGKHQHHALNGFIPLFRDYIHQQENLEKLIRQIIRLLAAARTSHR